MSDEPARCLCGLKDCDQFDLDYPWCRSCGEHHRPPECPIDQDGYSLAPCGCRWHDVDRDEHRPACRISEG
jgi:hypothetical protein